MKGGIEDKDYLFDYDEDSLSIPTNTNNSIYIPKLKELIELKGKITTFTYNGESIKGRFYPIFNKNSLPGPNTTTPIVCINIITMIKKITD